MNSIINRSTATFFVGFLVALFLLARWYPQATTLVRGAQVPPFVLPDSEGKLHSLDEYLAKNDFLLLHFWATWCPSCRAEMPNVISIASSLAAHSAEIIGISVDQDSEALADYLSKHPLPFAVLHDSQNSVMDSYAVSYLPTTILVSKDRRVIDQSNSIGEVISGIPLSAVIAPVTK